ncbi:MAG: hypothetical protein WCO03_01420 [bacterium]
MRGHQDKFNKILTLTLIAVITVGASIPTFVRAQYATTTTAEFIELLHTRYSELHDDDQTSVRDSEASDDVDSRSCDSTRISDIQPGGGNVSPSSSGGQDPVPVFEVGDLLTLVGDIDKTLYGILDGTRNIDSNTMQIKDISVDICYFLKSIRRIEDDFQNKEFVSDPAARRNAALNTNSYTTNYTNFVNNGLDLNGDGYGDAPLYVQNLFLTQQSAREEAQSNYNDDLALSGNPYSDQIKNIFKLRDLGLSNNTINPSLTRDEITSLYKNPESLDPTTFWNRFTLFFTGPNNLFNAYSVAASQRSLRENIAMKNVTNEYFAGQGYLPYRKCLVQSADQSHCRIWQNVTPGTTIKDLYSNALNSKLTQMENARMVGEDAIPGMLPSIGNVTNPETRDQQYPSENGDQPRTPTQDPDTFSPENQLKIKMIANSTDTDSGTQKIEIKIDTNADSCKTNNNWLSMKDKDSSELTIVRGTGDDLDVAATETVYYPLTFGVNFARKRGGETTNIQLSSTTEVTKKYVISIPPAMSSDIRIGDEFILSVEPFAAGQTFSTTTVASTTAIKIVRYLYDQLVESPDDNIKKYSGDFNYDNFTLLADPEYFVICSKGSQEKTSGIKIINGR